MAFFAILFLFPHTEHLVNSSMELGDFKVEFFFVGHHLSMMISITTTYDLFISFFTEVTEVMLGIGSAYGDNCFSSWFSRLPEIRSLHIPPSHWSGSDVSNVCQTRTRCFDDLSHQPLAQQPGRNKIAPLPSMTLMGYLWIRVERPRCQELDPPVTGFLKIRDCCNGKKVLQHVINKNFCCTTPGDF